MAYWKNKPKYKNRKVTVDGVTYDSKHEYERWKTLNNLLQLGVILDLRRQQKFVLIPAQRIDGKLIERECYYRADFVYVDNETGRTVVEDAKGVRTKDYIIKRKLMLQRFGIVIQET